MHADIATSIVAGCCLMKELYYLRRYYDEFLSSYIQTHRVATSILLNCSMFSIKTSKVTHGPFSDKLQNDLHKICVCMKDGTGILCLNSCHDKFS